MSLLTGKIYEKTEGPSSSAASSNAGILVVDDEILIQEILVRKLRSLGYRCDSCGSAPEALKLLKTTSYDLLLADVMMPEKGGIELANEARKLNPDLAIVMVTGVRKIDVAVDALKDGAYDYITKPFNLDSVSFSVAKALEKRTFCIESRNYQRDLEGQVTVRANQLREALDVLNNNYHSTLLALCTAFDSREADSHGHSCRVALYTVRLAREFGVLESGLRVIQQGALLHDIGKIGIPDGILRKPEELSEAEWTLMRKHPEIGFKILADIKFLSDARELVLQHQERYDGLGYPEGLSGEEIHLGARIFAVADTLECITSNRPFQSARSLEDAQEEISNVAGTQLDPWIVDKFLEIPVEEWERLRKYVDDRIRYGDRYDLKNAEDILMSHI